MQNFSGSHSCNKRGDKMARAVNHASLTVFGGCLKSGLVGGAERMKESGREEGPLQTSTWGTSILIIQYSQALRFISLPYIRVMTFHLKSVELSTSQCKEKWRGKLPGVCCAPLMHWNPWKHSPGMFSPKTVGWAPSACCEILLSYFIHKLPHPKTVTAWLFSCSLQRKGRYKYLRMQRFS